MKPTFHKLDPKGDTLLTLSRPNRPFITYYPPWKNALPQHDTFELKTKEWELWITLTGSTNIFFTGSIQMQLSSKHLQLASDYFSKMMANNNWEESTPKDGFSFSVAADGWNEEAFLTVIILHAQTTTLPQIVNLEMLAKVAVIVDYYQCHGATDFFTKAWIKKLEEPLPTSFGRSLLLRFLVSWVFSETDTFQRLSQIIIRESRGPVNAPELPIPKAIIDALDKQRQDIVSGVISGLHDLKEQFCQSKDECSFNCSSISLGALMKGMKALGLLNPLPTSPFHGYSIMDLGEAVKKVTQPSYTIACHDASRTFRYQESKPEPRSCSLMVKINLIIDEQLGKVNGLDLSRFINKN